MPGAYAFQKGVELRTVVKVLQVAELMEHYVVLQFLRQCHKP